MKTKTKLRNKIKSPQIQEIMNSYTKRNIKSTLSSKSCLNLTSKYTSSYLNNSSEDVINKFEEYSAIKRKKYKKYKIKQIKQVLPDVEYIRKLPAKFMLEKRKHQEKQIQSIKNLTLIRRNMQKFAHMKIGKAFFRKPTFKNLALAQQQHKKAIRDNFSTYAGNRKKPLPPALRYPDYSKINRKAIYSHIHMEADYTIIDMLVPMKKIQQQMSCFQRNTQVWLAKVQKIRDMYETTLKVLYGMVMQVRIIQQNIHQPDILALILEKFEAMGTQVNLQEPNFCLSILTRFLMADVNITLRKYTRAIIFLKRAKADCSCNFLLKYKMIVYKLLGIAYMNQKKYNKAKNQFAFMLQIALTIKDYQREIEAYDLIGIQLFYLGKLDEAHFFHNKMVHGDVLKKDSHVRLMAKQRIITWKILFQVKQQKDIGYDGDTSEDDDYEDNLSKAQTYSDKGKFYKDAYDAYNWKKTFTSHEKHALLMQYQQEKLRQHHSYMKTYKESFTKYYKKQIVEMIRKRHKIMTIPKNDEQQQKQIKDSIISTHQNPNRTLDFFIEEEMNFPNLKMHLQTTPFKEYIFETKLALKRKFLKIEAHLKKCVTKMVKFKTKLNQI